MLEQPRDECKKSPKAEDLSDTCMGDAYEPPSFTIIANFLLTSNFLFLFPRLSDIAEWLSSINLTKNLFGP